MKNEFCFKAPCNGYYILNVEVFKSEPTDEWKDVPSGRKWWQFWKPKTKKEQATKLTLVDKVSGIATLASGQTVLVSTVTRLHGDNCYYV
jgi:hypothetical protein